MPGKNIKPLSGKPLIYWTIDVARVLAGDEDICISTDSETIRQCVEQYGLKVPFLRPPEISGDDATSDSVIRHAIERRKADGRTYDNVVLLQPTSPFRKASHVIAALKLMASEIDMVVSVKESPANPYFNLFEEGKTGFLVRSKETAATRRQDCPPVYQYNGAIYIIKLDSLRDTELHKLPRVVKFVMSDEASIDIDTPLDWELAEIVAVSIAKGAIR